MLVPKSRIPKVLAVCPLCQRGTKTTMATPYSAGYMRRHFCEPCGQGYYSLAPYDGGTPLVQDKTFKDRDPTEYEVAVVEQMWRDEEDKIKGVTPEVTFLSRLTAAYYSKDRDVVQEYIMSMYRVMEKRLREFEKEQEE